MSGYKKPKDEYWKHCEKPYPKVINWAVVCGDKKKLSAIQGFDYIFNKDDEKFFKTILGYQTT